MPLPITRTLYLGPGFLCLPSLPTRLCTVIASGVAVTIYDRVQGFGGIGHYSHPFRQGYGSTADFAAPALVGLVRMFRAAGSCPRHLETHLYGGADNPAAPGCDPGRGRRNATIGREILEKLGVPIVGADTGGRFARKLVFYTGTGESMLAKVVDLDWENWYPAPAAMPEYCRTGARAGTCG
ncbi:MAG: chemotaxis protein CheD [Planctomycetes bacterium]|nr:chemotaxis protein CheD [Planctomycetota bacterium]